MAPGPRERQRPLVAVIGGTGGGGGGDAATLATTDGKNVVRWLAEYGRAPAVVRP